MTCIPHEFIFLGQGKGRGGGGSARQAAGPVGLRRLGGVGGYCVGGVGFGCARVGYVGVGGGLSLFPSCGGSERFVVGWGGVGWGLIRQKQG